MRIVKRGKIPSINMKQKRKKCRNCGTVMIYTEEDIFTDYQCNNYIICPVCNEGLYTSIFDRKVKNK